MGKAVFTVLPCASSSGLVWSLRSLTGQYVASRLSNFGPFVHISIGCRFVTPRCCKSGGLSTEFTCPYQSTFVPSCATVSLFAAKAQECLFTLRMYRGPIVESIQNAEVPSIAFNWHSIFTDVQNACRHSKLSDDRNFHVLPFCAAKFGNRPVVLATVIHTSLLDIA